MMAIHFGVAKKQTCIGNHWSSLFSYYSFAIKVYVKGFRQSELIKIGNAATKQEVGLCLSNSFIYPNQIWSMDSSPRIEEHNKSGDLWPLDMRSHIWTKIRPRTHYPILGMQNTFLTGAGHYN